jgi:hypothetical protein
LDIINSFNFKKDAGRKKDNIRFYAVNFIKGNGLVTGQELLTWEKR